MRNNKNLFDQNLYLHGLLNISTTDGREILFTKDLRMYLSEGALHLYRAKVEIKNLISLSEAKFPGFPEISEDEKRKMAKIISLFNYEAVAEYDHFGRKGQGPFEHDVKSVEVHLREVFDEEGLGHLKEFIHFPFTSEDVNNIAWNLMLRDALNNVWLPKMLETCDKLAELTLAYSDDPVIGKTHGMNASPTTFGKRFAYFLNSFAKVFEKLSKLQLSGKYSGPTGNHNAVVAIAPDFNFPEYAKSFVESFGFVYEPCENQRNSHLEIKELLDHISTINIVAMDLCQHIRLSVLLGYLYLDGNPSHVGSSVMPHKINPWFFEVGQGYLKQALMHAKEAPENLIISMFERDLMDHPWERSYGEIIGKSLIGVSYISTGLDMIRIDKDYALKELSENPEVLTEAVQMAGRLLGVPNFYMIVKEASRGKNITLEVLHEIIENHIPDEDMRKKLKALTPEDYIGIASDIAIQTEEKYRSVRSAFVQGILHPRSGLQAMLFDFDNTLHFGDKLELFDRLSAITKNLNLKIDEGEISEVCKESDFEKMKTMIVKMHNKKVSVSSLEIVEEMLQKENNKISGDFDHHLQPAEGAFDFLKKLNSLGYKTGLVTTRGSNSLPRLLKKHGYEGLFNVVVDRHTENGSGRLRTKPHPEPVNFALRKLEIDPKYAMFVGDKQTDDVIAGKALGMKTVLISEEPLDPHGAIPDYYFKNFKDFAKFFE